MATVVRKPWGHERILELNDRYCVKLLWVNAGQRLSLQYHERKHESMFVLEGFGRMYLGDRTIAMRPDDFFVIPPYTTHRIEAFSQGPLLVLETSTPELDDVVRLSDDHGRVDDG